MSEGKRFVVLDTENGRASHYADRFAFDVAELHEPFTPASYTEAILAADEPNEKPDVLAHRWLK